MGTPVTVESFMKWRAQFDAEQAALLKSSGVKDPTAALDEKVRKIVFI